MYWDSLPLLELLPVMRWRRSTGSAWGRMHPLFLPLASVGTVSDMPGVNGNSGGNSAGFDPFGWATRNVSEKRLHQAIKVVLVIGCAIFIIKRILEYDHYMVKSLWAVETAIYVVLLIAFFIRTHPVDRSQGAAEIVIPLVGALLPFALLLSPPARFVLTNRQLHM